MWNSQYQTCTDSMDTIVYSLILLEYLPTKLNDRKLHILIWNRWKIIFSKLNAVHDISMRRRLYAYVLATVLVNWFLRFQKNLMSVSQYFELLIQY